MKRLCLLLLFFLFLYCQIKANSPENYVKEFNDMKTEEIKNLFALALEEDEVAFVFLGYSGVIVRTAKGTIIIDPASMLKGEDVKPLPASAVNLILFTHSHGDHFSHSDALAIFKATGATILAESSVASHLKAEIPSDKLISVSPGKPFSAGEITVNAIRGTHVGPIILYHIIAGKMSIFHGGDSGYVPLKGYSVDLAFLPTGQPSPTASPDDAFRMAMDLKPKIIVTMHGSPGQNRELERIVKEKMSGATVIIPEPYKINKVTIK